VSPLKRIVLALALVNLIAIILNLSGVAAVAVVP
jgi:hypothetical protein